MINNFPTVDMEAFQQEHNGKQFEWINEPQGFWYNWACKASKFGDNLASVRKQVTNFQKSIEMAKETSIEIKGEWGWETNC